MVLCTLSLSRDIESFIFILCQVNMNGMREGERECVCERERDTHNSFIHIFCKSILAYMLYIYVHYREVYGSYTHTDI